MKKQKLNRNKMKRTKVVFKMKNHLQMTLKLTKNNRNLNKMKKKALKSKCQQIISHNKKSKQMKCKEISFQMKSNKKINW